MSRLHTLKWSVLALLIILSLFSLSTSFAQEVVTVGQDKVGEISATNPTPSYTFTAEANQQVTIRVSAVASPILPQFTILNSGGVLVQAVGNPNSSNSIEGVVTFSAAGTYSIQVSSADGSVGQFVLSVLSTAPTVPPTPLAENESIETALENNGVIVYSFVGNPNRDLLISLAGVVSAELTNQNGDVVATLSSLLLDSKLLLPASADSYLLKLTNESPTPVDYTLSLVPQTPEGNLVELPSTGACVLATRENIEVNVRSLPSTDGQVLATILPTQSYPVIGRNQDGSWYQINFVGGSGWVAGSVTRRGGDCSALAITATQTPVVTQSPTTNVTQTATQPSPVTTEEPTLEGTQEATQAPTEEATQEAGGGQVATDNDQTIQINIKNGNQTVTGAISFPNGDTQDVVTYFVEGFDSVTTSGNVVITAVCTGTGAENATVNFTGGAGGGVPCNGATSTQFHTNDSNQGRVRVSLTAGDGAFVNWTLVFSASN